MLALRQQQRRGGVAKGMEGDGRQSSAVQEWTVHVGEEVAGLHGSSESVGKYQPEIVPEAAGRLTLPFLTGSMAQKALKGLKANFSPAPTELAAVPPILEFDVNDPRFIDEEEILSGLDERTNLIDLTPHAFETVIRDLFQAMGFDTYQTRPSRDGGVDCVAHYTKSVIGGKYIIQAKRYVHRVPVEAVRDLAGALDHERASKGILVTTSDFTPAGYEFARGKPIELISGSGLLALFKEHTNLDVRIVMPRKD
jgi:restriction system protein